MAESTETPSNQEVIRSTINFREWLSVLTHTHTQLSPDSSWTAEQRKILHQWKGEGGLIPLQFPLGVLAEILKKLERKGEGFFVVDTPHPAHSLDEYH